MLLLIHACTESAGFQMILLADKDALRFLTNSVWSSLNSTKASHDILPPWEREVPQLVNGRMLCSSSTCTFSCVTPSRVRHSMSLVSVSPARRTGCPTRSINAVSSLSKAGENHNPRLHGTGCELQKLLSRHLPLRVKESKSRIFRSSVCKYLQPPILEPAWLGCQLVRSRHNERRCGTSDLRVPRSAHQAPIMCAPRVQQK